MGRTRMPPRVHHETLLVRQGWLALAFNGKHKCRFINDVLRAAYMQV
eukprot:COSAG05_NODE_465_length_9537_cov_21.527086_6_plen_47_part_00